MRSLPEPTTSVSAFDPTSNLHATCPRLTTEISSRGFTLGAYLRASARTVTSMSPFAQPTGLGLPVGVGMPPELLAAYVAGTFILVLNWWVESKSTLSPREADDVFLSMVLPTLTAITECTSRRC